MSFDFDPIRGSQAKRAFCILVACTIFERSCASLLIACSKLGWTYVYMLLS